jgi:hypothetical protein
MVFALGALSDVSSVSRPRKRSRSPSPGSLSPRAQPQPRHQAQAHVNPNASPDDPDPNLGAETDAARYVRLARAALNLRPVFDRAPCVSTVQALGLMAVHKAFFASDSDSDSDSDPAAEDSVDDGACEFCSYIPTLTPRLSPYCLLLFSRPRAFFFFIALGPIGAYFSPRA